MGRAPCCEKMGLKRGPWTKDEDQLLINYINENGHGNWRALPKKAGLLRCGKSCRLRWTNYLRPDIKRGNFSPEDEDAIIELHKELGNKWSAIAARLPGRTDNEIKNVWHTHLKKRLNPPVETVKRIRKRAKTSPETKKEVESTTPDKPESSESPMQEDTKNESKGDDPNSPSQSTSENNSSVTATTTNDATNGSTMSEVEKFLQVDEDFWSDVISGDYSSITTCDLPGVNSEPYVPVQSTVDVSDFDPYPHDDMEFWYNIFTRDGEIQDLLEL